MFSTAPGTTCAVIERVFLRFTGDLGNFLRSYPQLSRSLADAAHGFDGVDQQIENHLFQLDPAPCLVRRAYTGIPVYSANSRALCRRARPEDSVALIRDWRICSAREGRQL
jgi:hypothetical protein